jgi:hypothetical protein
MRLASYFQIVAIGVFVLMLKHKYNFTLNGVRDRGRDKHL